jgi:DsbC/DsbD-like thiol-disulfide interchange protein
MIATTLRQARIAAAFTLLSVFFLCFAAGAYADESPWVGDSRSRARLIAGAADDHRLTAGVELKLSEGWKTYWRYPGDSGVPPQFDFSGSENVAGVEVAWPAPKRLTLPDETLIGYTESVTWPLRITAMDRTKPVVLRVRLDYAVCEKLCVPVNAALSLVLDQLPATPPALLAAAEARIPQPTALGAPGPLSVRAVRQEEANGRPRVMVEVAAPGPVELFAEGPSPDWALPVPQPTGQTSDGLQRFVFDLDGVPPGAKTAGANLKLTAVSGDQAIEVSATLD